MKEAYDVPRDLIQNISQTPIPFFSILKSVMSDKNQKFFPKTDFLDYYSFTGTYSTALFGIF